MDHERAFVEPALCRDVAIASLDPVPPALMISTPCSRWRGAQYLGIGVAFVHEMRGRPQIPAGQRAMYHFDHVVVRVVAGVVSRLVIRRGASASQLPVECTL